MHNGGAMRKAVSQNKNQSAIAPSSSSRRMIRCTLRVDPNSTASNNPSPRTSRTAGCFSRDPFRNDDLSGTLSVHPSLSNTCKAARPAAQQTGCPPKVVICPSTGSDFSSHQLLSHTNAPRACLLPTLWPMSPYPGSPHTFAWQRGSQYAQILSEPHQR